MDEMSAKEAAEVLEKLIPEIESGLNLYACDRAALTCAASVLRKVAEGELREVVHARWVKRPYNVDNDRWGMNKYNIRIECTNCGFVTSSDLHYAVCPVCSAQMDGKGGSDGKD